MELLVDILGWTGAVLILTGYALISFKRVEGTSFVYQLLNILGSIFLTANTFYYGAIPSSLVNIIWAMIAAAAIISIVRNSGKKKLSTE